MLSTRDGIVISLSGLIALAVGYFMHEAGRREQRAELQAMEARLLAKLEAPAAPALPAAPVAPPPAPAPSAPPIAPEPEQAIAAPEQAVAAPEVTPEAPPSAPAHPLLGSWRCAFRSGEYSYPPMACEIRRKDGEYTLEKTQGSQRIKGKLALEGEERFKFSGLFFCPQGACDAEVKGNFTRRSRDHWVGTLTGMASEVIVVTLRRPTGAP